jgi:hypothetical protein
MKLTKNQLIILKTILIKKKQENDVIGFLLNCLTDELCDKGFNNDFEPNEYGLDLEALIDFTNNLRN